jgi:hypothetical protein
MEYRNLDLELFDYRADDGAERYRVRVADSPAGQQRYADAAEVKVPTDLRRRVRQLERRALEAREMVDLGCALADLLFPPRVRRLLLESRAGLGDGQGLRIRLRLHAYALVDLPWEYTYIPQPDTPPGQEGVEGFLALDRRFSLVRYELMEQPVARLEAVPTAPLRMVVLMADPGGPAYPTLDLDLERRHIEEALAGMAEVRPEFYPDATRVTLLDAVTREAHIFHFAGHGLFEGELGAAVRNLEGAGSIVLLDDRGQPFRLRADLLAQSLTGRGLRLAFLGACRAGARDGVNAWTGVAPALSRAGIPAVVAMQFTIRDQNAVAFSRQFYRALAAGQPVDAAVTDGRLAILNRAGQAERDWGVAVLYLRTDQAVLFPPVGHPPRAGAGRVVLPPVTPARDEVDRHALRVAMVEAFDLDELEAICADVEQALETAGIRVAGRPVQVNLEVVGGRSKAGRVLNLIRYLDRRGGLGYLVAVVRQHKPGLI